MPPSAAYVASDMGGRDFRVEAAARQFELDFVPLVTRTILRLPQAAPGARRDERVLSIMRGEESRRAFRSCRLPDKDAGSVKTWPRCFGSPSSLRFSSRGVFFTAASIRSTGRVATDRPRPPRRTRPAPGVLHAQHQRVDVGDSA